MSAPTALVLAAPGTNRDHDVAFALELAGAVPRIALLAEVLAEPSVVHDAQMLVVAGGFSYADALGAGRMWSLQLTHGIGDTLKEFVAAGKPVIGICNGFQVLTAAGLLPGALGHNASGHFQCEWVRLEAPANTCVWTQGLDQLECPIAHGEGRYVHPDPAALAASGQVALTYAGRNPNGSVDGIAAICNAAGNVFGLMPHPEDHVLPQQHPRWTRGESGGLGIRLFENGVRAAEDFVG